MDPNPPPGVQYVIDGSSLIRRISWTKGWSWSELGDRYVNYVTEHYGKADVVFDGYSGGPTTKDCIHI